MGELSALSKLPQLLLRQAFAHKSSLLSIVVRGITVLAGFAIAFIIGARLGPEALGAYALITQTAMFLSIVAVGGLDLSIVRHFPVDRRKGLYSVSSVVTMFAICLLLCGIIGMVVFVVGPTYLAQFEEVDVSSFYLTILCLILLSRAFTRTTSAFLRSQRRYVFSQIVEGLLIPLPILAMIVFGMIATVREILLATALSGIAALLVGVASSLRLTTARKDAPTTAMSALFIAAMPLWGVAIIKNFSDWYSLSVVGSQLSVADAGLFRVAWQITSALPIITVGIYGVFSPQIGTSVAQDEPTEVARLARTATRLSIILAVPAILLLAASSPFLLGLIGPEFQGAQTALFVLLAGQAVYVATGPSGIVLAIMGKQSVNLNIALAAFVLLLFAIPIGATHYGLTGVAMAIAIVTALQNLGTYIAVRKLLGIQVWSGSYDGSVNRKRMIE
ncbi:lipopolysaccharide biosynthesis protein [Erythrobacter sp. SD-21]|uniref:lipopolysaccharide biosynthesis protein n=1 Tax=Erythrobacter sp. SD-21 TaxID=161528 RepID=UPI000153F39B|nr:oligosaccharide flippase family protein [Erythrobacter sp. SD-21]EDL49316.1 hypothetical polysaccharide biosynthesis related protein [Erythrobacter sp. SD-21]